MPRVATPAARTPGRRRPPLPDTTVVGTARAQAAPDPHGGVDGPSPAAAALDLLPSFAPTVVPTAWLASLAAASTQGEMAAVSAAPGAERDRLLLLAETARALDELLAAMPELDAMASRAPERRPSKG